MFIRVCSWRVGGLVVSLRCNTGTAAARTGCASETTTLSLCKRIRMQAHATNAVIFQTEADREVMKLPHFVCRQ